MRYTVTYEVHSKPIMEDLAASVWWSVLGVVRGQNGQIIATDNYTAWTPDKAWVEKTFAEIYQQWNNDPRFNQAQSGERWREVITLP